MLRLKSTVSAIAILAALIAADSAMAQNSPACPPNSPQPCPTDANQGVETIVVTGSRIPRPETDSPNPVQSVGALEIEHSGSTNIADYLKRIPALSGSMGDLQTSGLNTPQTAAGSSLSGLNLLDLRNLGFDRTLVLEDGQRLVSSSAGDAAVDIDSIPITLIDRVDVVTGGSSAVYGADGVSGVVNFIMKHDLDGVSARIQGGASQDGGDDKALAAASIGRNFDNGDGNITFTFEEGLQNSLNYGQRNFTNVGNASFFIQNPANPDGSIKNIPSLIATTKGTIYQVDAIGAIVTNFITNPALVPNYRGDGAIYNPGTIPILPGEFATGGMGVPSRPRSLPTSRRFRTATLRSSMRTSDSADGLNCPPNSGSRMLIPSPLASRRSMNLRPFCPTTHFCRPMFATQC